MTEPLGKVDQEEIKLRLTRGQDPTRHGPRSQAGLREADQLLFPMGSCFPPTFQPLR